jgi:hypothetical protein
MSNGQIECTGTLLDGKVKLYRFAAMTDERGSLFPVDFSQMAFSPVRAFLVEAPPGTARGGHAHATGQQLLLCVSGCIEIGLSLNNQEETLVLNSPESGVLIAAPVWSRQTYCTQDSRLMVFCDTPYDPSSYIHHPI